MAEIYGEPRPFENQIDGEQKGDHMYGEPCKKGVCPLCRIGSTPVVPAFIPVGNDE